MVADPIPMPFTTPKLSTSAILELEDDHVPPVVILLRGVLHPTAVLVVPVMAEMVGMIN